MAVAVPSTQGAGEQPGRLWWIPLVGGLLSVIIGITALAFPKPTLLAVGIIFGIYLVVWATLVLIRAATADESPTMIRVVGFFIGILGALTGLVLIVRPEQSVVTAALVLGFWWTINGIIHLVAAIAIPDGRIWNTARGAIAVVAGVIILASPEIGLVTLVIVVGAGLIVQGTVEIAAGWELRRLHKEGML
jgi:uncharacterized membrane protein HdeD (DUF308 family)